MLGSGVTLTAPRLTLFCTQLSIIRVCPQNIHVLSYQMAWPDEDVSPGPYWIVIFRVHNCLKTPKPQNPMSLILLKLWLI